MDARLRARTDAAVVERDLLLEVGGTDSVPSVVFIDDIPINARFIDDGKRISRRDYFVLVVAEVRWEGTVGDRQERHLRLRLVRAFPSNAHHSWKLLFDELGYTPQRRGRRQQEAPELRAGGR